MSTTMNTPIFKKKKENPSSVHLNVKLTGELVTIREFIRNEMEEQEISNSEILKDCIRLRGFALHQAMERKPIHTKVTENGEEIEVEVNEYLQLSKPDSLNKRRPRRKIK